jgi:serine/threonine-protein kinase RsbW
MTDESIAVEFPSDYKYLNLVDLVCGEVVSDMGFSHEDANRIAISVIEACTNALEHGNRCCPDENVRLVLMIHTDKLVVEVYDKGCGFDYKSYMKHIPDPSDIHKQRGRGIYIMVHMMDSLTYEMIPDVGMKARLEKKLIKENIESS